jgi:hydrogenase nickel incorporation protein HypA/HybF
MLMHEMTVAQNLLAQISEQAKQHKAKPVTAKISCGKLNEINDEVLRFAFDAIAKGTLCQAVQLEIEHKPLQGRCKNCKRDFEVDIKNPRCSFCGGEDFELLPDAPLMLEQIEFETER